MTFTVYNIIDEPYTIDVETVDDLMALAEREGWEELRIDMRELTIVIS